MMKTLLAVALAAALAVPGRAAPMGLMNDDGTLTQASTLKPEVRKALDERRGKVMTKDGGLEDAAALALPDYARQAMAAGLTPVLVNGVVFGFDDPVNGIDFLPDAVARRFGGILEASRLPATLEHPLPTDPMQVTVRRLANGLTVYMSPNHQTPRISAWIVTRAGGAQDPQDATGIAHYLEHMLFKGSADFGTLDYAAEKPHLDRIEALYEELFAEKDPAKRKELYGEIDKENQAASKYEVPNEIDKAYKALGITGVNAFTSNERTVFVCDMPRNRLEAWAKLESDRFAHPVFRLFQSELEAVFEEKNRAMDNPETIAWEALAKGLYGSHPYGVPVLGWPEHIKNPSQKKMYEFYRTYYVPNDRALVLAGDFDPGQVMPVLERTFGAWKPRMLPEPANIPIAPLTTPKRIEVKYEAEEQGMLAWPTVPAGDPDRDALTVMDLVASNAQSGLIDLRLNQAQKVKSAGSFPEFMNEAGSWTMYFLPKEGQTLEEAEGLMMGIVDALKKGDFSEDDLKANVLNYAIDEKYKLESNEARVTEMADSFAEHEDWAHAAARLERLRKVTKADVMRVANKYLGEGRVVVFRRKGKPEVPVIEKPGFTKVAIEPGRQSAFIKELLATPAPAIEPRWVVKGRDYAERKTPYGELIAVKNPMNDLFSLSWQVERGTRQDRQLTAALGLWEKAGAGDLPADALKRRLYALGVKMDAWAGARASGWSLSGPDENLEPALELLRERFLTPNVEAGTLDKMVQIWIGQHKDNKVDPEAIRGALQQWAERGEESEVLRELKDDELKSLTEKGLKAELRDFLAWRGRVSYVGPRGLDAVAALLKEKGASYKPAPPRPAVTYLKPAAPRVVFVHRDMVQSKVGLYAADGAVDPERMVDYRFFSNTMGGGMSSVVFQEVREARSLAYSAWGGYAWGQEPADENRLVGQLGCQADKTGEAVDLMLKLLRDPPFTADRFKEAKDSILQGYRTDPLTFRQVPGAVLEWEDMGYPVDPRPARFRASERYTLADLDAFAERMKGKTMTVYILGNKERVKPADLAKFGAVEEKTVDDLFPY